MSVRPVQRNECNFFRPSQVISFPKVRDYGTGQFSAQSNLSRHRTSRDGPGFSSPLHPGSSHVTLNTLEVSPKLLPDLASANQLLWYWMEYYQPKQVTRCEPIHSPRARSVRPGHLPGLDLTTPNHSTRSRRTKTLRGNGATIEQPAGSSRRHHRPAAVGPHLRCRGQEWLWMSSHVHTGAQSLPPAGIGEATTVVCLADIAARLCSRDPPDTSDTPISSGQGTSPRPAWRRAPRTKAALVAKVLAIEEAVRVLEDLDIPYTQPLFGKLVIEPPPAVQGGKSVTFWPAKKRLRIGRRATQRQQRHSRIRASPRGSGSSDPGLRVSTCKAVEVSDAVEGGTFAGSPGSRSGGDGTRARTADGVASRDD